MNTRAIFLILVALVAVVVLTDARGCADDAATTYRGAFEATMHRGSNTLRQLLLIYERQLSGLLIAPGG